MWKFYIRYWRVFNYLLHSFCHQKFSNWFKQKIWINFQSSLDEKSKQSYRVWMKILILNTRFTTHEKNSSHPVRSLLDGYVLKTLLHRKSSLIVGFMFTILSSMSSLLYTPLSPLTHFLVLWDWYASRISVPRHFRVQLLWFISNLPNSYCQRLISFFKGRFTIVAIKGVLM